MWTYFIFFLGGSALLIIFIRRVVLVIKGKKPDEKKIMDDDKIEQKPLSTEKISNQSKKKADDLCKRGEAFIKAGKDDEAIKCFVQALSLNPDHRDTMQKLAILYMHKQMHAPASALFKELCALEKDSVHYSHLGLSLYNQGLFEEAKEAYQEAVDLDPSRPQRFISLCQVYRSLNDPNMAIISINKAIDLDMENLEYRYLLADLLIEIEDFNQAKIIINEILENFPDEKDAKSLLREIRKMEKNKK